MDNNKPDYTVIKDLTAEQARMTFHELRGYIGAAYANGHDLNAKHHRAAILAMLGIQIDKKGPR